MKTISFPISSIEAYIQQAYAIPLLTPEEEYRYATQYQEQGDLKAAQKLVLSHLRYVIRVARGYLGYGLALNDLVQEGTIGLMKAVKRFDPKVGVRLVSFAVHWIKAEIHEFILRNWRIVRVATTKAQRKLFFNLRSASKRLGWNSPTDVQEIATDLGVSALDVERMEERLNARDVSFDLPTEEGGASDEMRSLVPVEYLENLSDPAVLLEEVQWQCHGEDQLEQALKRLDPRSGDILKKRWLNDNKTSLQVLADQYKVSIERIRQLEQAAILKLKAFISK